MCECSKGYTCPQHVARVNANAAVVAKQRRTKGMTIRQAIDVMHANRNFNLTFRRNKETMAAARILMGAYFSSGQRGYLSFQNVFEHFTSKPAQSPRPTTYKITLNSYGYYFITVKIGDDGIKYLSKNGVERTSCNSSVLDGSYGYFKHKSDAEAAVLAHKTKNGIVTDEPQKWENLVKAIQARSYTIERKTYTNSSILLDKIFADSIAENLRTSGFNEVTSEHVILPKPINELGLYMIQLKFARNLQAFVKLWVVTA